VAGAVYKRKRMSVANLGTAPVSRDSYTTRDSGYNADRGTSLDRLDVPSEVLDRPSYSRPSIQPRPSMQGIPAGRSSYDFAP